MPAKKHVVIHHPCTFTRMAINTIISSLGKRYGIYETDNLSALLQAGKHPRINQRALLITYISSCESSLVDTLNIIDALQRQAGQALKIIVLTNCFARPMVVDSLNQYRGVCVTVDEDVTMTELSKTVNYILNTADDIIKSEYLLPTTLTTRERYVMKSILRGISLNEIACILEINSKTVSHHKLSALRKLGVRNVSGLFF